jgi:hypothetical protein
MSSFFCGINLRKIIEMRTINSFMNNRNDGAIRNWPSISEFILSWSYFLLNSYSLRQQQVSRFKSGVNHFYSLSMYSFGEIITIF